MEVSPEQIAAQVAIALEEDLGGGDDGEPGADDGKSMVPVEQDEPDRQAEFSKSQAIRGRLIQITADEKRRQSVTA